MRRLRIAGRVTIPEDALTVAFARASGPGGQNVNKVASKVELHVDLGRIEGLDEGARQRLDSLARRRDRRGRWLVTSQRTRDQHRNLEDALAKVRAAVARCLVTPRRRHKTRPSAGVVERRLSDKRRRSERKRLRSTVADW
jgi:ribosome-associated protein